MTYRSAEEIGSTKVGPRPLPALGEQRAAPDLPTVDTVLSNGLRLVAVRQATVPMVELRMHIPFAGNDPAHTARAEVLAHTMLTGTAERDRLAMDTTLALIGGELDASVDPERLRIAGRALSSGVDTLLDVLGDVLTSAAYQDDEVSKERDRLAEHIAVARAQPNVLAREALQRQRYGNHPFSWEIPQAEDVAEVGPEQVRGLHAGAVLPRGSALVLVGDIDPDQVVTEAERALGGWRSENAAAELAPLPEVTGSDLALVHRPGAVQSQLRLSAEAVGRTDPRNPALRLANLAFGGYFSSRLVENIREDKGYTYHARSSLEYTPHGATLLVEADTASEVTAAALLETRYELGKLGLVPPTESEAEAVRQYAIGALLTSSAHQQGLASQLDALIEVGLDVDWLREQPARLAAVTAEQIGAAALEFFAPSQFTGVVLGDAELLSGELRALGGVTLP